MYIQQRFANVSVCQLNQWSMDFEGNYQRILKSCQEAKKQGSKLRVGPELEIPGYGCEDHFLEQDTIDHSWEILQLLLQDEFLTQDIICTFSMPVNYNNVLYNCTIVCLNQEIILIRPKMALAENGNYRESRYFTRWTQKKLQPFILPNIIQKIKNQKQTVIGNALIQLNDTIIGIEICEELWSPLSPNIQYSLQGTEIFINPSASHHELRKSKIRYDLIHEVTSKQGGIYLYSNMQGCDGGRLYFDGQSMIMQNGNLLAQGDQFLIDEIQVNSSFVNLDSINNYRVHNKSFGFQASIEENLIQKIQVDFNICDQNPLQLGMQENFISFQITKPEYEIGMAGALWLWDQLRRSKASGFFLPLSGGADSAATATIVYIMCEIIFQSFQEQNQQIIKQFQEVIRDQEFKPQSVQDITKKIFFTSYMGSKNSSQQTKDLAKNLANQINSNHYDIDINPVFEALQLILKQQFNQEAKFKIQGGTIKEDLTLQNMQARSRMIIAYMMSQIIPAFETKNDGFILVLGSANLDECLRGYFTKYDCSSADLNPIGSISKNDLKCFLRFSIEKYKLSILQEILIQIPTAELTPLKDGKIIQSDEADMGMTYDDLSIYGKLRKIQRFGPVSMFKHMIITQSDLVDNIAQKVKKFFTFFSQNRHKMTIITPSLYSDIYNCDDNRYDLRQFLYPKWEHQFKIIEQIVRQIKK